MSTGTANGSLAGEGAWLLSWFGRRKVAMDEQIPQVFGPSVSPASTVVVEK